MLSNNQYKILVIDDEPGNIEAIISCLQESNYKISIATDGESGFQIAQETLPDLIITDWDMPNLSGIATIKLFKSNEILKNTPIIMATGKMIKSEDLRLALDAGADDYIRKPVDKLELIARTRSMILLYETMKHNLHLQQEIYLHKEAVLKNEIEDKKKDLAYITLKLVQQSKFSSEMLDKLSEASDNSDEQGKKILHDISNQCKLTANQTYWDEFELIFKQVHKTFYDKLDKRFPDLTKNERRIAAFSKLNMSAKDVASITFQSEPTLKKARQRLRGKLNIDLDTKLNDFFQQL